MIPDLSEADRRLDAPVSVVSRGDQLCAVLSRLTDQTGVWLEAEAPMGETSMVIRWLGRPLRELLRAFEAFYAVDGTTGAHWKRDGTAAAPGYRLGRDSRCRKRIVELREQREALFRQRMEDLVATYHSPPNVSRTTPTSTPAELLAAARRTADGFGGLSKLAVLSPEERLQVYFGEVVTHTVRELAGDGDPAAFCRGIFGTWGRDRENPSGPTGVGKISIFISGRGDLRAISAELTGDPSQEGGRSQASTLFATLFSDRRPENRQREWRSALGADPEEDDDTPLALFPESDPPPSTLPTCELTFRIAERAGISLIADDYGRLVPPHSLFRPRPIQQQLDVYCHRVGYHRHACYLWRRRHGTYLLRSSDWLDDELLTAAS